MKESIINVNLKRSIVYLYDNMKNEVIKLDVSVGISLVNKEDVDDLKKKLEKSNVDIPRVRMSGTEE